MFEDTLNVMVKNMQDDNGKQNSEKTAATSSDINFPKKVLTYYVNFEGNFGKNYVTPRGLKANLVNQFVQVQGIVTRMSLVQPKIQTSVHYCETTKKGLIKHYDDKFNLANLAEGATNLNDGNNTFPTKDNNDNPLSAEYGYCVYKDS
jgi:DNA replication licensing factor MCM3